MLTSLRAWRRRREKEFWSTLQKSKNKENYFDHEVENSSRYKCVIEYIYK